MNLNKRQQLLAILAIMVILLAVLALGAGPGEIGTLAAAQTLPFLLLSIPAGLLADRWSLSPDTDVNYFAAARRPRSARCARGGPRRGPEEFRRKGEGPDR